VAVAPHLITMVEARMDREVVVAANSTSLEEVIAADSVAATEADQEI
jgi:hypothetical protein